MRAALIYPHQLFADHPALCDAETCVLVEEPLLMSQYRFHHQKLILHRTSMQHFAGQLRRQRRQVHYVECGELDSTGHLAGVLRQLGVTHAQFVNPSMDRHRDFFVANPRMSVMVAQCDRMGSRLDEHRRTAAKFLARLHGDTRR